tara:strand:+ start:92 stop:433 length:342 start_codon:yes stop_codon:yes gene_type:complete
MWFCEDIWNYIKGFMFHNIKKQGKHLKDDPYIQLYNKINNSLPKFRPFDIGDGPYIIYTSKKKKHHFIKFIYVIKYKKIRLLLVTWMVHMPIFGVGPQISHDIVCEHYFNYSI